MPRTSVLLADDHPIVIEGLQALLHGEFDLIGVVHDGRSLVSRALEEKPDVIVTDIFMPLLNGLDAARLLKAQGTTSKIVVLTMHTDVGLAARAFHGGVSGYVLKHAAGHELIQAIRTVLTGAAYISPTIAPNVGSLMRRATDGLDPAVLTIRQREVLQLIGEGKTMKEIGGILGISSRTAETHKYEIMQTLGAANGAELVIYAIRLGLISPGVLAVSGG